MLSVNHTNCRQFIKNHSFPVFESLRRDYLRESAEAYILFTGKIINHVLKFMVGELKKQDQIEYTTGFDLKV